MSCGSQNNVETLKSVFKI